ncbi:MAG: hypothetical protein IJ493_08445 [Clostridia bacterium]|nr:hypothetical protein [Clostridia bacterium]
MNYLTQLLGFRLKRKLTPISSSALALYVVLLENFNTLGFPSTLCLPNTLLAAEAHIGKTTVNRARAELVDQGYIHYTPGQIHSAGIYQLIELDPHQFAAHRREEISPIDSGSDSAIDSGIDSKSEPIAETYIKTNKNQTKSNQNAHSRARAKKGPAHDAASPNAVSPQLKQNFDEFWQIYPRKTAYRDTLAAYAKLAPSDDLHRLIIRSLRAQTSRNNWNDCPPYYVPTPVRWLESEGWKNLSEQDIESELMFDEFFQAAIRRSYKGGDLRA